MSTFAAAASPLSDDEALERQIETARLASLSPDPQIAAAGRIAHASLCAARTHSAEPTGAIDALPASPSRGQAAGSPQEGGCARTPVDA